MFTIVRFENVASGVHRASFGRPNPQTAREFTTSKIREEL